VIYVVWAEGTDRYKVGFSSEFPAKRMASLAVGCPFPLVLVALFRQGTVADERAAHNTLRANNTCGEWFNAPLPVLLDAVSVLVGQPELYMTDFKNNYFYTLVPRNPSVRSPWSAFHRVGLSVVSLGRYVMNLGWDAERDGRNMFAVTPQERRALAPVPTQAELEALHWRKSSRRKVVGTRGVEPRT
jgi:hypothetical protein